MAGEFTQIDANATGVLYALTGVEPPGPQVWTGLYRMGAGLPAGYSVVNAWTQTWLAPAKGVNGGIYIVARTSPTAGFLGRVQALVTKLNSNAKGFAYRYILWIDNPDPADGILSAQALAFSQQGSDSSSGTVSILAELKLRNIVLVIAPDTRVTSADGAALRFVQFAGKSITLSQRLFGSSQIGTVTSDAAFALADPAAPGGGFSFDMTLTTGGVRDDLATLRTGIVYSTGEAANYRKEFSTALAKETTGKTFTVSVRLNPIHPTFSSPALPSSPTTAPQPRSR